MNQDCSECNRLKQESDDAIRLETRLLAQSFTARDQGNALLLTELEPLVRVAREKRIGARHEIHKHKVTHPDGETPIGRLPTDIRLGPSSDLADVVWSAKRPLEVPR
jgi:hypothetical protein